MEQNTQIEANNNGQKTETWWRTQSATMALLKHAYKKIDDAEEEIATQENRIKALEKLASTDELTGLYNRRGFLMEFERNITRMKRHDNSLGSLFILLDLNKFKQINDTYGHMVGDKCLQLVSNTIMGVIRSSDTASRFGGDEFALLLSEINQEDAIKKANIIHEKINNLSLKLQDKTIEIKTSMGFGYCNADTSFADVYCTSDVALYSDKAQFSLM